MSSLTDQLQSTLYKDMTAVLDDYQLDRAFNGGDTWPDMTVRQMRAFALIKSFFKKYNEGDDPPRNACDTALEKFLAVNDRCGEWELMLESSNDEVLYGQFKMLLYHFWNVNGYGDTVVPHLAAVMHKGGVGPGASAKARAPDFYTKVFDGPHSSTSRDLQWFWEVTMRTHPRWRTALTTRARRFKDPIVRGNTLSFVNKNVDTARCISTEPFINMWFQKGVGELFEDRLKEVFNIDLSTQPGINAGLAQEGSETGGYATIDLKSASDSISVRMLEQSAPRGMLNWLKMFRSPVCRLPSNRSVSLNMIATMGNGFCFPLQCAIFSCVVAAAYSNRGIPLRMEQVTPEGAVVGTVNNFGVFGDDIIVRTSCVSDVVRLLNILGFEVNRDKTHVEGPFRESCGGDYFNGYPVRGVYIKALESAQDVYVAINTLNRWSAMTGIRLPHTVGCLRRQVAASSPLVPCDEADTAGIHVPSSMVRFLRRGQYGMWYYRKDVPIPVKVQIMYEDKFNVLMVPDVTDGRQLVDRNVNLAGLHVSSLGGYINGGTAKKPIASFTTRQKKREVRYETANAGTPMWDYHPTQLLRLPEDVCSRPLRSASYDFAAWKAAVTDNLLAVL